MTFYKYGPKTRVNDDFRSHSTYDPQMTSDDIISPSKNLIWPCGFILQLLHHTVDQCRMSSAESDSYQSESSGSDNLYMDDDGEGK